MHKALKIRVSPVRFPEGPASEASRMRAKRAGCERSDFGSHYGPAFEKNHRTIMISGPVEKNWTSDAQGTYGPEGSLG
jgi:hypothetical protein